MQLWRYGFTIERLGKRYRLIEPLGSGGMADVCLALDENDNSDVAIKILRSGQLDGELLGRFTKEASLIAGWRHPHIIHIHGDVRWEVLDAKKGSLLPYIVMEYIREGNLNERLSPDQPYPFPKTLDLFKQICSAVQYAHEHGIIHRDIKPENILFRSHLEDLEDVVLSDFGMAVSLSATHHTFSRGGTPSYMAPEQLHGQAQVASDIYSLGVILYQLCTGRLPFQSQFAQIMHPLQPPPCPSSINTALPSALDEILLTALSTDPDRRFPSAQIFSECVQDIAPFISLQPASSENSDPLSSSPDRKKAQDIYELQGSAAGGLAPRGVIHNHNRGGSAVAEPTGRSAPEAEAPSEDPYATTIAPPTGSEPPPYPQNPPSLKSRGNALLYRGRTRPLLLFLLVILLGGFVYASTNLPGLQAMIMQFFPHPALITIVPASEEVADTYVLQAVTSPPNADQLQVRMRTLDAAQTIKNRIVVGEGLVEQKKPLNAKGRLTFINGSFAPFTVASGTIISAAGGISVATDQAVVVPAGVQGGASGSVSVPAHVVTPGAAGNLSQDTINESCCSADENIFVRNDTAFTGGADAQTYTFVQQKDVDAVAAPFKMMLSRQAIDQLKQQIKPNEKLVGDPTCNAGVQVPAGTVGDQGHDIDSTTATVTVKCTGIVYDQGEVQAIAKDHLQRKANVNPGPNYVLVGNITMNVQVSKVKQDSISLQIDTRGIWAYRFDAANEQALARQLINKKVDEAQKYLNAQHGMRSVKIETTSDRLPNDPKQITFTIQKVLGVSPGR